MGKVKDNDLHAIIGFLLCLILVGFITVFIGKFGNNGGLETFGWWCLGIGLGTVAISAIISDNFMQ